MTIAAATADATGLDAIRAIVGELLSHDRWTRAQLLELQRKKVRALLDHAVARSPYYREALGPDAADKDFTELPTLSKGVLMDEFDRVITEPGLRLTDLEAFLARARPGDVHRGDYRVFATSGSTGIPGLFVFSQREFAYWTAVGLSALDDARRAARRRAESLPARRDRLVRERARHARRGAARRPARDRT